MTLNDLEPCYGCCIFCVISPKVVVGFGANYIKVAVSATYMEPKDFSSRTVDDSASSRTQALTAGPENIGCD